METGEEDCTTSGAESNTTVVPAHSVMVSAVWRAW